MTDPVDTRKSLGFRSVKFASVDECKAEVQQILAAAEAGTLTATGNWTPGQIMSHLANWIDYAYVGFPVAPAPLVIRWMLRLRLRKMLNGAMPRGVWIPGVAGGTAGMDDIDTEEAGRRLLAALERLQSDEEAKFDSPAFGAMSHADRIALNLRHAELHLGFLEF